MFVSLGLCLSQLVQADPGGTLITPRGAHTATLLADGRVLVAGGSDGNGAVLAASEIYNPAMNTWTATGNLNQVRRNHETVLLPDGRALTLGGLKSAVIGDVTNTAEIYNPASGTWTTTGNMITGRAFFDAVLLANGKVLVAGGGVPFPDDETAKCELYDPATGIWSATGSLLQPRTEHHATLLANGRVLVAGGFNETAGLIAQSELYDPATGTWSSSASFTLPRNRNAQVRLADGRVLVAGGIKRFGFDTHRPRSPRVRKSTTR